MALQPDVFSAQHGKNRRGIGRRHDRGKQHALFERKIQDLIRDHCHETGRHQYADRGEDQPLAQYWTDILKIGV